MCAARSPAVIDPLGISEKKGLSNFTVSAIRGKGDLKPGRKVVVSSAFRTLSPSLVRILSIREDTPVHEEL